MSEINNKSTSKETLLYLYILGQGNKKNYIRGVVPYRINNEELFYGPCKMIMREEIRLLWGEKDFENNKMPKMYLVGINPAKDDNESQNNIKNNLEPRKILFAGEILEIFTFKEAWDHYDQIICSSPNDDYKNEVEKMRRGIKIEEGIFESPLHLEPILNDEGILIGYKHRTNMHKHKNEWIKDLLSDSERNLFNKTNEDKHPKEIYKKEKISFKRDCCFKLTNILFSLENNQCPIELTDEMFKLIKPVVLEMPRYIRNKLKPPDISSPFGYNKLGHKYGRGHITLRNAKAERLIQLLIENK